MRLLNDDKKYRLTKKHIILEDGTLVYQIKALKAFADVHKGQLGGYVHSTHNLSQHGNCWIYDEAIVYEHAKVEKNACIFNHARICGHALISDFAIIHHHAQIKDHVCIYDNAIVCDHALIQSYTVLNCHASLTKNAQLKDEHDFYTGYLDAQQESLNRQPITLYYTPQREVRVVYHKKTYNLQGFIDYIRMTLGYIAYAEAFRPQLINARRRMYFTDTI